MVRGLYVVGCLTLDVFGALQVRMSFPGQDAIVLTALAPAVILLTYVEIRLYRRIWPRPRKRWIADEGET